MIRRINSSKRSLGSVMAMIMLFLSTSLITVNPLSAQSDDDSSDSKKRELRYGSCFFDGKENCRKKRNGTACTKRKRCGAQGVLTAVVTVIAIANALED